VRNGPLPSQSVHGKKKIFKDSCLSLPKERKKGPSASSLDRVIPRASIRKSPIPLGGKKGGGIIEDIAKEKKGEKKGIYISMRSSEREERGENQKSFLDRQAAKKGKKKKRRFLLRRRKKRGGTLNHQSTRQPRDRAEEKKKKKKRVQSVGWSRFLYIPSPSV